MCSGTDITAIERSGDFLTAFDAAIADGDDFGLVDFCKTRKMAGAEDASCANDADSFHVVSLVSGLDPGTASAAS